MTRRSNNRKATAQRKVQYAPKYSQREIAQASTTIEKLRRSRCIKNIKIS